MTIEEPIVMPLTELWAQVVDYVDYLYLHNQTEKVEDVFDSINRHNDSLGLALKPMLKFMSKHGMPEEFPEDGSHFNESRMSACPPTIRSPFEVNLIAGCAFW